MTDPVDIDEQKRDRKQDAIFSAPELEDLIDEDMEAFAQKTINAIENNRDQWARFALLNDGHVDKMTWRELNEIAVAAVDLLCAIREELREDDYLQQVAYDRVRSRMLDL